jgi:hypothetical protein
MYEGTYLWQTRRRRKSFRLKRLVFGFVLTVAAMTGYGFYSFGQALQHADFGLIKLLGSLDVRLTPFIFLNGFSGPPLESQTTRLVSADGKKTALLSSRGLSTDNLAIESLQVRSVDGRLLASEDFFSRFPRARYTLVDASWKDASTLTLEVRDQRYLELPPLTFSYSTKTSELAVQD